MENLNLVVVKNPFDRRERDIMPLPCPAGLTLRDLRQAHFPAELEVCASLNGELMPREHWPLVTLQPGDHVVFVPSVHDSDTLRIVAFIALAVFAPQIAVGLAPYGASALTLGLITTGVMLTGGMLINHLLPPPKPNLPTLGDSSAGSPAYSWSPQTTQQQGMPVARWYGVNKLIGNVIGAYIEDDGGKQYLNALIDLGQGPYKRLYGYQVNGQPIENYHGVEIHERRGDMDQTVIEGFNDTKTQYATSVKVVNPTPYTYATTGSAFNALEVEVTFPQGLWHSNDAGGLDAYSVSVQIEVRKTGSSDPWMILTRSYVDITTVASAPHWSKGTWQYQWSGDSAWQEYQAGSTDPYAHEEGNWAGYANNDNSYLWHWISATSYQTVNTLVDYTVIAGAQTQPIRRVFRIDNLPAGQYDVRVTNLTGDQTSTRYGDDLYLTSVTEVVYDDFTYPRTVLAAVRALATDQLSGALNFSCLAECALVRRWNGSAWSVDLSDNPAWVCWDILTQPVFDNTLAVVRYDGIDPSRLDLTKFYAWAQFCDGLVPDGNGNTEKRCTFNGGFDTQTTMWDAALQVCTVARAVLVWNGISLTVSIDQAQTTPVQLFSVGNIGADSFKETFLPFADRAAEIEVDFVNQARGYERDKLTVFNTAVTNTVNKVNLQLFGITRQSQAWREAMYRLYRNQYITRTCEIAADIDAIACTVGDLISVQHDVPIWGEGGRLVAATASSVTLDKEVTIVTGKTYQVTVRLADDSIVIKNVTNAPGIYTVLTLSTPFSVTPAQYDVYAFGETAIQTKPFVVVAISRSSEQQATLTCVEYNATIYNVDTDQPVLPTVNYTAADPLPPVTGLVIAEQLVAQKDGTISTVIDVTWKNPVSALLVGVEIWYTDGTGWKLAGTETGQAFRIWDVKDGATYTVAIASLNYLGERTKLQNAPQASRTIVGKTAPPANVTGFSAGQNDNVVLFRWDQVADVDLAGYEIRYIVQGQTNWDAAISLTKVTRGTQITSAAVPPGVWTFLIKARDTSGNYSATAASCNMTVTNAADVIVGADQAPDWLGTKTNCIVHWTGVLVPEDQHTAAFYGWEVFDQYVPTPYASWSYEAPATDLGFDYNVRVWASFGGALGPGQAGFINPKLQIDYHSGAGYTGWKDWTIGNVTARYFKERFTAYAADGVGYISSFKPSLDVQPHDERGTVTAAIGGTPVTFTNRYYATPNVQLTPRGGTALFPSSFSQSGAGFSVKVFDAAGTDVGGAVDWFATGD